MSSSTQRPTTLSKAGLQMSPVPHCRLSNPQCILAYLRWIVIHLQQLCCLCCCLEVAWMRVMAGLADACLRPAKQGQQVLSDLAGGTVAATATSTCQVVTGCLSTSTLPVVVLMAAAPSLQAKLGKAHSGCKHLMGQSCIQVLLQVMLQRLHHRGWQLVLLAEPVRHILESSRKSDHGSLQLEADQVQARQPRTRGTSPSKTDIVAF